MMNKDVFEWFEIDVDDCPTEAEREFLTALCAHSSEWLRFGLSPDAGLIQFEDSVLTVALDVSDHKQGVVLRTLRIDFDGSGVVLGYDETGALVTKLDVQNPDVKEYREFGVTPTDCANAAAEWLEVELARRIERREWNTPLFKHQEYVVVDMNQCIAWSDSQNKRRSGLGVPHRVTIVHP
jgi:hypothetical protein